MRCYCLLQYFIVIIVTWMVPLVCLLRIIYIIEMANILFLSWFYMCKKSGETVDHLLLHWDLVQLSFGLSGPFVDF
jgi:hypothetical protein